MMTTIRGKRSVDAIAAASAETMADSGCLLICSASDITARFGEMQPPIAPVTLIAVAGKMTFAKRYARKLSPAMKTTSSRTCQGCMPGSTSISLFRRRTSRRIPVQPGVVHCGGGDRISLSHREREAEPPDIRTAIPDEVSKRNGYQGFSCDQSLHPRR